ncbi:MAG: ArsR family transcriptional regulator [Candidatus Helarchaeota archaeon]
MTIEMPSMPLTEIQQQVLNVALDLVKKRRELEVNDILTVCKKKIKKDEKQILSALYFLFRMKYIVPGSRLTKMNLFENTVRKNLHDYIAHNPGVHVRELQDQFQLGSYAVSWHLHVLVKFGLVKERNFSNKRVYFLSTFGHDEEKTFVLRTDITRKIYESLLNYGEMRLSELEQHLGIKYNIIQYHLKRLEEVELIERVDYGGITKIGAKNF